MKNELDKYINESIKTCLCNDNYKVNISAEIEKHEKIISVINSEINILKIGRYIEYIKINKIYNKHKIQFTNGSFIYIDYPYISKRCRFNTIIIDKELHEKIIHEVLEKCVAYYFNKETEQSEAPKIYYFNDMEEK